MTNLIGGKELPDSTSIKQKEPSFSCEEESSFLYNLPLLAFYQHRDNSAKAIFNVPI